jgi:hypothetical protein
MLSKISLGAILGVKGILLVKLKCSTLLNDNIAVNKLIT